MLIKQVSNSSYHTSVLKYPFLCFFFSCTFFCPLCHHYIFSISLCGLCCFFFLCRINFVFYCTCKINYFVLFSFKEDDPLAEEQGLHFIGDAVEYVKVIWKFSILSNLKHTLLIHLNCLKSEERINKLKTIFLWHIRKFYLYIMLLYYCDNILFKCAQNICYVDLHFEIPLIKMKCQFSGLFLCCDQYKTTIFLEGCVSLKMKKNKFNETCRIFCRIY